MLAWGVARLVAKVVQAGQHPGRIGEDAGVRVEAHVVRTIRPDTVFIPYHWPGRRSANRLTHRTLDPRSKIPEYKVSACRIQKVPRPADLDQQRQEETGWTAASVDQRRQGA